MRTKAIRSLGLAAAMLATLTACGGRGDDASSVGQGDCKGQQTTGITDTSIKLGGTYPLSGPASAYSELPKGVKAYFDSINAEQGGINGRKVDFVLRDDGYQPAKTVEEVRRLVEQDQVFAIFQTLGTATSSAVWDYLNQRKVPQVFVATGATQWGSNTEHPWTIGWQPSYHTEGVTFAEHVKKTKPNATVAVLYQNDDFGKDLLAAFTEGIAGSGVKVVDKQSYEVTDPSVEPQIRNLAGTKPDVLLNFSTPKFAAQALAGDARNPDWNPMHIVTSVSNTMTVLRPVGLPNVQGLVSAGYLKEPTDPTWAADEGMKTYKAQMAKYGAGADPDNALTMYGWAVAETFHKTMATAKCPTREGLRDAMRAIDALTLGLTLPGVEIETGKDDGYPIEAMRIQTFSGDHWSQNGELVDTAKK